MRPASTMFVRKRDAELWLQEVELQIYRGERKSPDAGQVLFGEYARKWIAERPNVRPRTVTLYESMLWKHLAPTVGNVPAAAITYLKVLEWRQARLDAGVGPVTGAQVADQPPPPPPSQAPRAQRRVPADGVVQVARQRLRVGASHAGKTVTIVIEDTIFRVLHNDIELSTHIRKNTGAVTRFKAHARAPQCAA